MRSTGGSGRDRVVDRFTGLLGRRFSSHRHLVLAACLLASFCVATVPAFDASASPARGPVVPCGASTTSPPTGAITATQVGRTVTVSYHADGYASGAAVSLSYGTAENDQGTDTSGQAVADSDGHLVWSSTFQSNLTTGSGDFAAYCVSGDTFLQEIEFGWGTPTGSVSAAADCSSGGDGDYIYAIVHASFTSLSPSKGYHLEVTSGIPEETAFIDATSSSTGTLVIATSIGSDEGNFRAPYTYQWMLEDSSYNIVQAEIVDMTANCERAPGMFSVTRPVRILDTRGASPAGPVAAGTTVVLDVDYAHTVPSSGVSAVVLNVTATAPTGSGVITVYPDGTTLPPTSNLNYRTGQTVANLVEVPVSGDDKVDLHVAGAGTVQLVVDVSGYYLAGQTSAPGTFAPVTPARLLDTRIGNGATRAPVAAGHTLALTVTGRGGLPSSGLSAVALNVTATGSTGAGLITAYADGAALPKTSNVNYAKGQTVANLVMVPVGANGKVDLHVTGAGTVQLVADVVGFYRAGASSAPGSFVPLPPARTLDTRIGTGAPKGAVKDQQGVALAVDGHGGVPTSRVSAVVLNLTATAPTELGVVAAYADGTDLPQSISNLNYARGQTVANLVVVSVGGNGAVELYVDGPGNGSVQLVADVVGYYRS